MPPDTAPEDTAPQGAAGLLHEGVRRFNAGEWFEAHEVWEDLWHQSTGPEKRFYQGLIQLAVTLVHMQRGNPRGTVRVFDSACAKLAGYPPVYQGLRAGRLLEAMRAMVDRVRALPAECFRPGGRGIDLPVDLSRAPRIEIDADTPQTGRGSW